VWSDHIVRGTPIRPVDRSADHRVTWIVNRKKSGHLKGFGYASDIVHAVLFLKEAHGGLTQKLDITPTAERKGKYHFGADYST
jgi:hypothetical protein